MLTEIELQREAAATGFRPEVLEKVIHLIELLNTLRSHPFLKPRIALKGGTALNLFVFDVPRLSVDIDLNYIGGADRATMTAERPKVERAIEAVCGRLGLQVKRIPAAHAGGKWRLSYMTVGGRPGTLELDLNFLLRMPLWRPAAADSHAVGSFSATDVPVLERHELAAGKLAALFGRDASRDLFDVRELLRKGGFEPSQLRLSFVVYGGANRRDWREVSLQDVQADPGEVDRKLIPMLRGNAVPPREQIAAWSEELAAECRDLLAVVLPLTPEETEFIRRLNDTGDIAPELLTDDAALRAIIQDQPALRWKALNVKKRLG